MGRGGQTPECSLAVSALGRYSSLSIFSEGWPTEQAVQFTHLASQLWERMFFYW